MRVRDQLVTVLLKDVEIEENTMLVPMGRDTKFRTLQLVEDLAPLNV